MNNRHFNLFPRDDDFDRKRKERDDDRARKFEDEVVFPFGDGTVGNEDCGPAQAAGAHDGDGGKEYCPDCDEVVDPVEHERKTVEFFAEDIESNCRGLAFKLLWDIIWSLANPSDKAIDTVLNQLVDAGSKNYCSQAIECAYEEGAEGRSIQKLQVLLDKATKEAAANFKSKYGTPLMTPVFLKKVCDGIKKNLK